MSILVTRENFNKLMCNVTVTDVKSKSIIDDETTMGVYSFISMSKDDKTSFSELIRTPLYLFRITDYYCYMIVYNNFESDFLSALWYHGNDNWVISKVAPENKVKIAIQTNSINRFLNNFKFLTMTQFKEHYGHPVGFSMIGEKSIREAINNDNFFPFIPQEVLHTAADFIISYVLYYKIHHMR